MTLTQHLEFYDNSLISLLVGPSDRHLLILEKRFGVSIALRGNTVVITGRNPEISYAKNTLQHLYDQLSKGLVVDQNEVELAIKTASNPEGDHIRGNGIVTKRRIVFPRTSGQSSYVQFMQNKDMVFCSGPAGTGKTYLAVAVGVSMLVTNKIDKIILSRPAVEAGEKLGFLPGDMKEKVDPYLRPLYDALNDMLPIEEIEKRLTNGEIEIAPLAFMRGRTLSNAFVILDEAQNTTPVQMKMFLTRLGHNSSMVITGDLTQIDLSNGESSGLKDAIDTLSNISDIAFINLSDEDVVRHSLVSKIVVAYDKRSKQHDGK